MSGVTRESDTYLTGITGAFDAEWQAGVGVSARCSHKAEDAGSIPALATSGRVERPGVYPIPPSEQMPKFVSAPPPECLRTLHTRLCQPTPVVIHLTGRAKQYMSL